MPARGKNKRKKWDINVFPDHGFTNVLVRIARFRAFLDAKTFY